MGVDRCRSFGSVGNLLDARGAATEKNPVADSDTLRWATWAATSDFGLQNPDPFVFRSSISGDRAQSTPE